MNPCFDNEFNILKYLHELKSSECLIFSDDENTESYLSTAHIIDDILSDDGLTKWKDNSKSNLPPDLINEKDLLVMEVMRVDDHSSDGKNNPVLAEERKIYKEAKDFIESLSKEANLFINAVTGLPTELDHNYKYYYSSFQRTMRKHLSKLPKYKANYPTSKVIFLVFDETSGIYLEKKSIRGNKIKANIHYPFFDNRFLKEFINSDLDYLIWYIPYNHYRTDGDYMPLPRLIIFDIKNAHNSKQLLRIDYDENKMMSNEK